MHLLGRATDGGGRSHHLRTNRFAIYLPRRDAIHDRFVESDQRPEWHRDEVQLVLDNQIRRSQWAVCDGTRRGETSHGPVQVLIIEIRAVEAVTATLLIYLAKEHLRRPVPGHLGKFVDGRDEQRRQAAIDLLVDDQHRQAFRRVPATEGEAAQEVAAVDKRTAASLGERFDLDIPASIDGRAAPGTVGQLARRADAPDSTAPLVQAAILPARFFALFSCIGSGALPNPKTQAERRFTPCALLVFSPENLTGANECRR